MRRKILLFILFIALLGLIFIRAPKNTTYFIPFDEAQVQDHYTPSDLINFYHRLKKKRWRTLYRIYNVHLAGRKRCHHKERIPKIIHQIYLEGPLPEKYKKFQQSWIKHHPDWEYHLWTEEEVKILYLKNEPLFQKAETLEEKTTILRYEILNQFGGVMVDVNFECLKPFDSLIENCDFFAGTLDQIHRPEISSALIGAQPNHPILKVCIQALRNKKHKEKFSFTKAFFEGNKAAKDYVNVILPATYFYPLPRKEQNDRDIKKWVRRNSFAIYYWRH